MLNNIFVVIICMSAVVAAVFGLWLEYGPEKKDEDERGSKE